ncbi:B12-binding domain-containing radical SAM protein [Oceanirhabdus sp. W0125-5]|uniref:B12-binding domain-containing radical SAM protein n=1 Tax=Oceanirhabdus sp. W0125-5 TaxID=2999116 RepID=UPI0022F3351F|nr:B12-binding domain-containing radical SAM protein [Oceanirhabdus sp. W0125-5]WBW96022.1 B12-binding domain-containing radical SAM protein [Oceanirhabdus sp. W0125-5]
MKVLLCGINSQYVHSNLAIRYLKAYVKDIIGENLTCDIREFTINERKEKILEDIITEEPDLVVFSTYIWNGEYVRALSRLIKAVDENIKILYGGPEVSYESENFFKNNPGEFLIEGEGEETFREFFLHLKGEMKIDEIKGLYHKKNNGEIIYNGPRDAMDMNKIVFPYSDDDDLQHKIVYYEASRGCPFNCKYCLSATLKKLRFLNVERVKKELKYLCDKGVHLVKFVDRTFNSDRVFSRELWTYLSELDTDTKFHFEISADLLKDEDIEILKKAPKDRFQFEVGVQSTDIAVLKNINRVAEFSQIADNVRKVKACGNIMQHLDLIAGLPGEDFETFKRSFNDVYDIRPDEIQLGFLKLIKGSPLREEAEKWEMKYSPYQPYEILQTKHISYRELLKLKKIEAMVNKYYNSGKFENIIKFFEDKFETPFDFYYELGMFFENQGYFNRNISSKDYYKVFLEFNDNIVKEKMYILKEIVKYDYLLFNKKRHIPEFLNRLNDKKFMNESKEYVKNNYPDIDRNSITIEKYEIDILSFIHNGKIVEKESYLLYDIKNNEIIDITKGLKKEGII